MQLRGFCVGMDVRLSAYRTFIIYTHCQRAQVGGAPPRLSLQSHPRALKVIAVRSQSLHAIVLCLPQWSIVAYLAIIKYLVPLQ